MPPAYDDIEEQAAASEPEYCPQESMPDMILDNWDYPINIGKHRPAVTHEHTHESARTRLQDILTCARVHMIPCINAGAQMWKEVRGYYSCLEERQFWRWAQAAQRHPEILLGRTGSWIKQELPSLLAQGGICGLHSGVGMIAQVKLKFAHINVSNITAYEATF